MKKKISPDIHRFSIAECTPPTKLANMGKYIGKFAELTYDYKDIPLSFGVEIFDTVEFNRNKPKYEFIKFLGDHGFHTEVHVNHVALMDILRAEKIENSKTAQILATIKNLERVVLNWNASFSDRYNPENPLELSYYLRRESDSHNQNRVNKTVVMLLNPSTKDMLDDAVKYAVTKAHGVHNTLHNLGIAWCPKSPVYFSYIDFEPLEEYSVKNTGLSMPQEYMGKISPGNIYEAATQMADNGISDIRLTVRDGVMKGKQLDLNQVRWACDRLRLWRENFVVVRG